MRRAASCGMALVVAACTPFGSANGRGGGPVTDGATPDGGPEPGGANLEGGADAPTPEACRETPPTCGGTVEVLRFDASSAPPGWTEHSERGALAYEQEAYCGSRALHATGETTAIGQRAHAYVSKAFSGTFEQIKIRFAVREPTLVPGGSVEYGCGLFTFDASGADTDVRLELGGAALMLDGESDAENPGGEEFPVELKPGTWRPVTLDVTVIDGTMAQPSLEANATYDGASPKEPLRFKMPGPIARFEVRCGVLSLDDVPGRYVVDIDDVQIEVCR